METEHRMEFHVPVKNSQLKNLKGQGWGSLAWGVELVFTVREIRVNIMQEYTCHSDQHAS